MEKQGSNLTVIEREDMYRQIVECSPETTVIHSNHEVLYINQTGADFINGKKEDVVGANVVDVFTEEYRDYIVDRIQQVEVERQVGKLMETTVYRMDGTRVEVELYCYPVLFGETKAVQSTLRDITSRKEAERKLAQVMNDVTTPIVPVSEGIGVVPLVGSVDEDSSQQLLNIIPSKVRTHNIKNLIIDVSGIYNMDEVVVNFLHKLYLSVELLGITPICTGLRPELAQTMVKVYGSSGGVPTQHMMSNVKQALDYLNQ